VVGAAMRTPPHDIYVSPMPLAAMEPLADALLAACPDARGVGGTVEEAEAFAAAWARRTGARPEVRMRTRIYRLDAVVPPERPPAGAWRQATPADRELLLPWTEAFHLDVEPDTPVPPGIGADLDTRIASGRALVWVDGEPVSYVGVS